MKGEFEPDMTHVMDKGLLKFGYIPSLLVGTEEAGTCTLVVEVCEKVGEINDNSLLICPTWETGNILGKAHVWGGVQYRSHVEQKEAGLHTRPNFKY